MNLIQLYTTPGDHPIMLTGVTGVLEAMLMCPVAIQQRYVAILGHPHSLQGGTMQNKVVTTLARAFRDLGIPSVRFNFRGVGASAGVYDAGIGESADMVAIAQQLCAAIPGLQICLAGFSFGAYVAFRAAVQIEPALLISIAPAVKHYDFTEFNYVAPWIIAQGDNDDVADTAAVCLWHASLRPAPELIYFSRTGHFFHARLTALRRSLAIAIINCLRLV